MQAPDFRKAAFPKLQNNRLPLIQDINRQFLRLEMLFLSLFSSALIMSTTPVSFIWENFGTRSLNHYKHIPCSLLNNCRSVILAYGN